MPLNVVALAPENNATVQIGTPIEVRFSQKLNQNTFTERMVSLTLDGQKVQFSYSIDEDLLTITPQSTKPGTYEFILTGYDPLLKLYLRSVEGQYFTNSVALKFTYESENGAQVDDPTTGNNIIIIDSEHTKPVELYYQKVVMSNSIVIKCSLEIKQPFEMDIHIDRYDADPVFMHVTVSEDGNFRYNRNIVYLEFSELPNNQIVKLTAHDVVFENNVVYDIDAQLITMLKPYINLARILSEISKVTSDQTILDQYYAQLYQIFKIEAVTGKSILNTIITQQQRMLIENVQIYKFLQMHSQQSVVQDSVSVDTGQQKISYKTNGMAYIQYGRLIDSAISEFESITPKAQKFSNAFTPENHTWRIRQIKLYEEYRQSQYVHFGNSQPYWWNDIL